MNNRLLELKQEAVELLEGKMSASHFQRLKHHPFRISSFSNSALGSIKSTFPMFRGQPGFVGYAAPAIRALNVRQRGDGSRVRVSQTVDLRCQHGWLRGK